MKDGILFSELNVEQIRKEVLQEFTRIKGEDYDEWLDFINYEVNYRLQNMTKKEYSYKSNLTKNKP